MTPINLSFAACGFLGIYHLGAASALCRHGRKFLQDVKGFAGASAGSLVATVLLTAPGKIEECNKFIYEFAEEIRRQSFGAVTPGYDFMARLRRGMESILPPNAYELAHNRLHVSITNTKTRENDLVSRFSSRDELIKVLLASSFVPIYAGLRAVEYKGQVSQVVHYLQEALPWLTVEAVAMMTVAVLKVDVRKITQADEVTPTRVIVSVVEFMRAGSYLLWMWADGGLTNSLPILPLGRTVTISPFSGRVDISPQDRGQLDLYITISKQDVMLSVAKLVRLNQDLFPPNRKKMQSLYRCGFDDTITFLRKENWFE